MISRPGQKIITDLLLYTFLIFISVFMILPFIWMLSTSFKLPQDIFGYPPRLIPENLVLDNYLYIFQEKNLLRVLANTFFVALSTTLLSLFFTALGGYGFAKFNFLGKNILFALLLATMIIPGAVMMVPSFVIMRELGWVDKFWPLIIPGAANAFGIFFFRQYISTINDELMDAARIDGASEFKIFWSIILPIISPGMTSLGLIFFMRSWNDYLGPLIYLKSPQLHTITLAINALSGSAGLTAWGEQMAMSVVSLIPLLIIFLIFQRRFVEGIMAGAVKG
ncbi:MAG TPA: carbohydrate ABC transporter permease [Anaerolineales bacterium]|nr:carbohydrate ABC transporter permease [Anaerolineales bacterium]